VHIDRQLPVLVTGSAGAIGSAAVLGLITGGYTVRGFDRVPTPHVPDFVVADLSDRAALDQAISGVGAIIHLAAVPDDDDFLSRLVPNNIVGLHHVLEAARAHGIKRVVLASSGQVVWWQILEGPWPIGVDVPCTPRGWYAITKVAAEAAGQTYARNYGMSVIAVRLGWFPRTREHAVELASSEGGPDLYLSPSDAGQFFAKTMAAPLETGFWVVYAASKPLTRAIFDLEPARRLLDWQPQDQWPTGAEHWLA
jgi:uronate dehydrogenase